MTAAFVYFIIKLGTIRVLMLWGPVVYLAYRIVCYCRYWMADSPENASWTPYWRPLRWRMRLAAVVMLISVLLPSTPEASVIYAVHTVAHSGIVDRIFGALISDDQEQRPLAGE